MGFRTLGHLIAYAATQGMVLKGTLSLVAYHMEWGGKLLHDAVVVSRKNDNY